MKYKVEFFFVNSSGILKVDDLSDNGEGFTIDEANSVAFELMARDDVLDATVVRMCNYDAE